MIVNLREMEDELKRYSDDEEFILQLDNEDLIMAYNEVLFYRYTSGKEIDADIGH